MTALLNIYRTYMQGDYMRGEWAEKFAEVLETDIDKIKSSPSATYPTELSFPERYFSQVRRGVAPDSGRADLPAGAAGLREPH